MTTALCRKLLAAAALTLLLSSATAQTTPNPGDSIPQHAMVVSKAEKKGSAQEVPTRVLDLTRTEAIPGLPAASVVAYPRLCSSDGEIFSLIYAVSGSDKIASVPEVYGVSPQRDVKHLTIPLPQNFKFTSVRSFFPGKFSAIYLVQGSQPTGIAADANGYTRQFFLSRTDRSGGDPELLKLQLPFEPYKLAVFDSGDVLSLGANTANLYPVLALLHPDGTLNKILNFDDRAYRDSIISGGANVPHPNDSNTFALQRLVLGSLAKAQLVPWGSEVLLVQPGSNLPVYRIVSSGAIEAVHLSPPQGFLLQTILGSSENDSWLAIMQDVSSFVQVEKGRVAENPPQKLFEIDPHTGNAIRTFEVKGPQPGEVSCGSNRNATAIYYAEPAKENAPSQLFFASAPR